MLQNIAKPFHHTGLSITYIILVLLGCGIWWYFTDIAIMFGNYGTLHTSIDISLSIIMILGFPLFIISILYKGLKFGIRENMHHTNSIGAIGGIFGTILSGCSCCGLTLASYFGLLPLMNLLPYAGLEIKIISTIGLLWAIWESYRHLEICRVKNISKKK